MKILDSLIKVAAFRREQEEHRRTMLMARMERLKQSKRLVAEDLQRLQENYLAATEGEDKALKPVQLVTLRQLWIEAQERQQLMKSLDEQLESMERERQAINKALKAAWAKEQSLERARELAMERRHAEELRKGYAVADDSWFQSRAALNGVSL